MSISFELVDVCPSFVSIVLLLFASSLITATYTEQINSIECLSRLSRHVPSSNSKVPREYLFIGWGKGRPLRAQLGYLLAVQIVYPANRDSADFTIADLK
jgi:hypothetical protein